MQNDVYKKQMSSDTIKRAFTNKLLMFIVVLMGVLLITGCPSHRKKANCSEIRYRLDHIEYTEDQKEWIVQEWELCEREADSLGKVDAVKYRGIYEQFSEQDSTVKDSTAKDSIAPANVENLEQK